MKKLLFILLIIGSFSALAEVEKKVCGTITRIHLKDDNVAIISIKDTAGNSRSMTNMLQSQASVTTIATAAYFNKTPVCFGWLNKLQDGYYHYLEITLGE